MVIEETSQPWAGPIPKYRELNSDVMNICVFLSAVDLDERYTRPAREFAELIGNGGHSLVWGGSDTGLMKVVADGVRETGGRLVGISVELFRGVARSDADEMVFAKDLAERKALLLGRADAIVVMAGGLGTLDEAPTTRRRSPVASVGPPAMFMPFHRRALGHPMLDGQYLVPRPPHHGDANAGSHGAWRKRR